MKPDWKDAPEWAQWLAQDLDGSWFWYEQKPVTFGTVWIADFGKGLRATDKTRKIGPCEPRPK